MQSIPMLKACGVLIVRGQPVDSFLLMIHPTRYDLPKGHLDPGETEIECALRELEEETAINPDDVELAPDFRFATSYQVRPKKRNGQLCDKTLVVFLGRLRRDVEIVPTEHNSYEWRRWDPPHRIQQQTIDPLLEELACHLRRSSGPRDLA